MQGRFKKKAPDFWPFWRGERIGGAQAASLQSSAACRRCCVWQGCQTPQASYLRFPETIIPTRGAKEIRAKRSSGAAGRLERLVFRPSISTVNAVNKTVIEVHVRAVLPTSGGCAVFIGNSDKVFIVYVDQTVGSAITMFMREMSKERPLTHDLMAHLMTAVGAHVERVIINDLKNATYYARMIIAAENELQQKKIIELDARPSDCIAMATQQKAPIYVSQEVWDEVEDMSDVLRKMEEEGLKPEIDPESEATEEE